jgi:hypothetical protein
MKIAVSDDVKRVVFQGHTEVLANVGKAHQQYQEALHRATEVLDTKKEATRDLASGLAKLHGVTGPAAMRVTEEGELVVLVENGSNGTIQAGYVPPVFPTIQELRDRATKCGAKIDDLPPQAKAKILARIEEAEKAKK